MSFLMGLVLIVEIFTIKKTPIICKIKSITPPKHLAIVWKRRE